MAEKRKLDLDERGRVTTMSEFQKPGEKRQAALRLVGVAKKEYWSPFNDYENVEVWGGFAINENYNEKLREAGVPQIDEKRQKWGLPHIHGLEIERDLGYIRITEDKPIIAVAVMGSGCSMPAYVVCEYPEPGLTMEEPDRRGPWRGFNIQNLRQQRVEGMMSQHQCSVVRTFGGDLVTYDLDFEPRVRECSARFEIEPTTTVTIRGGSELRCHFSFRMIRVYFEMGVV